ncbi:transposase [Lishizhenia tianjinensis]|uniref:transposase n=1 Tax=Lishizhenia tianjinensis TaxID=477690 RepID=UPI00147A40D7|nr:transposase [Lishizhenia tianjinensis]
MKRYRTVWYLSMKLRMAMGNNLLAKEYFLYFTLISKDKSAYCGLKAIQNYSITAISRGGSHKTDEINLIAPIRLLKKVSAEEKRLSAKGYRCLKLFNTHKKIELKKSYYPVKTHEKNWLNYLMANENRILNGTHHGVSYLHLQKYMFEYSFNYNLRFCNKFKILVESILT